MQSTKKLSTRELCYIGIFVAIIALCAQVTIPQPGGVPFSLQAWGVALAGLVLGSKNGAIAVAVYILLGAIGAPVFTGFGGGFGRILGATGGFILSFPLLAFFAGRGFSSNRMFRIKIWLAIGVTVNYVCGMLYFSLVTSLSLPVSFGYSVAPFILPGIVKILALPWIAKSIKTAMQKAKII